MIKSLCYSRQRKTWRPRTRSILLCMLLHGSFDTMTGDVPATFEVLHREVYVTLLVVQDVTLLAAVAVLVVATRGRLGFDSIPRRKFG